MERIIGRKKKPFTNIKDQNLNALTISKTQIKIKSIETHTLKNSNKIQEKAFFISDKLNNKEIFIQGGCNSNGVREDLNILDVKNYEWKNFNNISRDISYLFFDKKIYGHKSITKNIQGKDCIIVYGGLDGEVFNKQVYIIDKDNFEWDSANYSNCEYPLPRSFHTMNYDEDSDLIYIYGGWDANLINFKGDNFTSLWEFQLINSLSKKPKSFNR